MDRLELTRAGENAGRRSGRRDRRLRARLGERTERLRQSGAAHASRGHQRKHGLIRLDRPRDRAREGAEERVSPREVAGTEVRHAFDAREESLIEASRLLRQHRPADEAIRRNRRETRLGQTFARMIHRAGRPRRARTTRAKAQREDLRAQILDHAIPVDPAFPRNGVPRARIGARKAAQKISKHRHRRDSRRSSISLPDLTSRRASTKVPEPGTRAAFHSLDEEEADAPHHSALQGQ